MYLDVPLPPPSPLTLTPHFLLLPAVEQTAAECSLGLRGVGGLWLWEKQLSSLCFVLVGGDGSLSGTLASVETSGAALMISCLGALPRSLWVGMATEPGRQGLRDLAEQGKRDTDRCCCHFAV